MKILVTVRNGDTLDPVPGAKIKLSVDGRELATLYTGSAGDAEHIERMRTPGKTLSWTALHEDYDSQRGELQVGEESIRLNIRLKASERISEVQPSTPAIEEKKLGRKTSWLSHRPRLLTALLTGMGGGVLTGVFYNFLYDKSDPLSNLIHFLTMFLYGGLVWAIAGAVAGPRRLPLLTGAGGAILMTFFVIWAGNAGFVARGIEAAMSFGAPAGAIVGAAVGGAILKKRAGL